MKIFLNKEDKKLVSEIRKKGYVVNILNNGGMEVNEPCISLITKKKFYKDRCWASDVYAFKDTIKRWYKLLNK